jgi:hypothetical protein
MPMNESRRNVMRALAALGLGGVTSRFGVGSAFAQTNPKGRRFVFAYIPGGWDQLLFLDPREHELGGTNEQAYRREVERTHIDTQYIFGPNRLFGQYANGNYFAGKVYRPAGAAAGFVFGPGTVATEQDGKPRPGVNLVQLVERGVPMAIIRGLNMGTLGHEPGYVYMLTGEPAVGNTARGASLPVRVASKMGAAGTLSNEAVTPVLALGIDSFTGDKNGVYGAFSLSSIQDSARLLERAPRLVEHPDVEQRLSDYAKRPTSRLAQATADSAIFRQLHESSARASRLLESRIGQRFAFLSSTDAASEAIRQKYGLSMSSSPTSASALAAFAAQVVKNNLAQFVSLKFVDNFCDSHGGTNAGHMSSLFTAIDAIARLVDDLATTPAGAPLAGSWLDNTTIVVFSEFGRTPMFNHLTLVGRDHHFTNSCLLIGAGIKAGSVIGGTTETGGMQPRVFDFGTYSAMNDDAKVSGEMQRYLLPEDVGATLLASAGLDFAEFRGGKPLWPILLAKP